MRAVLSCWVLAGLTWLLALGPVQAQAPDYTRTRDVIYGRKFGLALTMDVFTPKKANGLGVIHVVSGGWRSGPEGINPLFYLKLLDRGYTVFAVVHGSQPRFTILDIRQDMNRAVRFIRYHARTYQIEPDQLGIMGASAGGHLSLLQGTTGDKGNSFAIDSVERVSSKVQTVACFFPPTDFLNYGIKGKELLGPVLQPPYTAAMDFHEFDQKKALFLPIKDEKRLRDISRSISPACHVSAGSAPSLLIHGDKDRLVPLQQSEWMVEKLKEAGVPAKLIIRKDAEHGWANILDDMSLFADWFDEHLRKTGRKE
jgi:acetyl esterase/lipase